MAMPKESDMTRTMRTNMNAYRKKGLFTDLIIECSDKKIFAHKLILWSVPSQIRPETNDKKYRKYKGDDIEKIIDFIYTETIDLKLTADALHFCKLSKEFGLEYLEKVTIEYLIAKTTNIDDCLDIWLFADKFNVINLRKSCLATMFIDFKQFITKSISKLSDKELESLLKISPLNDFENYEVIKEWGTLEKKSKDRQYFVQKLFDEYVTWSKIPDAKCPKISSDKYMINNFNYIIVNLFNDRFEAAESD